MKRDEFIKKTIISGAAIVATPALVNADTNAGSTYNRLIDKLGYNHIPNEETSTKNTVLHRANTRGYANRGWLKAKHSFSFANYHNPERMHFGVLRVLNDDIIAGGKGFGTHPHDNMEIITIPLEGSLQHKDNMGNGTIIKQGDIQVMSAGTGVTHSEFNANNDKDVKLLQIWLFPNKKNVKPRYGQISLKTIKRINSFYQILSPNLNDQGVWIHQDSWFSIGDFDKDISQSYALNNSQNGVYVFMIEGQANINGQDIGPRDGYGLWNQKSITVSAKKDSKILLLEVPMSI